MNFKFSKEREIFAKNTLCAYQKIVNIFLNVSELQFKPTKNYKNSGAKN